MDNFPRYDELDGNKPLKYALFFNLSSQNFKFNKQFVHS